ncbi:MAG: DUF4340 domain-containing protein [Gammaproteobacteria bacterium]|nr:DUF4340 domain-containing protein [Gammaproteobacteria bacterium]
MNTKSLAILIIFLLVGAGVYFFSTAKNSINTSESINSEIIPALQPALNDIAELQVIGAGSQVLSTLLRSDSGWLVKERNQYPADISKIRSALLSLAEAKIVEQKTSNPELYNKLGVESIEQSDAQGIKAVVRYGAQTSELIVGKPGPQINKSRYVRIAGKETSWLIDRKIDLKHQPDYWLRKDILSIEPSEVAAVTILLGDNSKLDIKSTQEEEKFEVTNLTDPNSQVIEAELHQVTNALSSFQLLDVAKSADFEDAKPTMNVKYQLKTGVDINIAAYELEKDHYAALNIRLSSHINEEQKSKAEEYIDKLTQLTSGWVYKIPNVTYESMNKREADVLAITEDQLN